MRYQALEYKVLSDGTAEYGVLQYPAYQQQTNAIIGFGIGMIFMAAIAGMIRAMITGVFEPEKPSFKLLPQTKGKSDNCELEKMVIALRDAPTVEDQIFIKLYAPAKVMDQYRKLSYRQIKEIEQRYPEKDNWSEYQPANISKTSQEPGSSKLDSWFSRMLKTGAVMAIPSSLRWLMADNRTLSGLDFLPTTETENKVEGILKKLKAGVESIQQSEQFRLFLSTMSKFHDYSIGNMILIMIQKPQATYVAGFNTWKELGRWVKSGEKGISILAPVFPPAATCEICGARLPRNAKYCPKCGTESEREERTAIAPRFFRVVYVFDVSQTEGKPLPEFDVPSLSGEANEALFSKVLVLAKEQGLTVSFESKPEMDPETKGYYSGKQIWVRPEESRAQQLKTLLHEVAHHYSSGVFQIQRKDAETIAESAAFAIGAHFGFDTGVRSFPYVAIWSQDKKTLEQNLAAIREVTGKIIDGLDQVSSTTIGAT